MKTKNLKELIKWLEKLKVVRIHKAEIDEQIWRLEQTIRDIEKSGQQTFQYEGEIFGKKIVFSREEFENIANRFDKRNAQYNEITDSYEIYIPCVLCEQHRIDYNKHDIDNDSFYEFHNCMGCPLGNFREGTKLGCIKLFTQLLGEDYSSILFMGWLGIGWNEADDVQARKMLDVILAKIRQMEEKVI